MKYYPVVIFCYNRPVHLKRLLDSIYKNEDFNKHQYFFYCDFYRNEKDKKNNICVKKLLNRITKIKKKKIIFRKQNFGLSKNIIDGINHVFQKHSAAIIFEDDLILNKFVLNFLNSGLNYYKSNRSIYSISGYSYLTKNFIKNKIIKVRRHSSWGWATWKNKWKEINFNNLKFFQSDKKNFNILGNDMSLMLDGQNKSLIDSWAIRFNFYCFKKKKFSIQPSHSMVKNIGNDSSGYHKSIRFRFNENFDETFNPLKFKNSKLNNDILKKTTSLKQIDNFIQYKHKLSMKLFFKLIFKKFMYE